MAVASSGSNSNRNKLTENKLTPGSALVPVLRLPKLVEADPRAARLLLDLTLHSVPLWSGSEMRIPVASMSDALAATLKSAYSASRVVRGMEGAEQTLATEERGMRIADRQSGALRGLRVSRLLILANDGAERFYRQVESLLRRHGPRVLAIRVAIDAEALGALLFGPGRRARLLMLEHKDAVAAVLLAMAGQWGDGEPDSQPRSH